MVDYLSGNELRIPFDSRDSITDLYLLDDGSVNEQLFQKSMQVMPLVRRKKLCIVFLFGWPWN
ncbi:MAG: hypothetical protein IPO32_20305 [Crocinitomicaceae bacterium]|nr:hypothetical protein [Crocinitomicaceae bacterium]